MKDFERELGSESEFEVDNDSINGSARVFVPDQSIRDRILNYGGVNAMSLSETADYLSTTEADVLSRTLWRGQMDVLGETSEGQPDSNSGIEK